MTSLARDLPAGAGVDAEAVSARRRARARRKRVSRALTYVAAVLMALWVLAPIYLITITAFSPSRDATAASASPARSSG